MHREYIFPYPHCGSEVKRQSPRIKYAWVAPSMERLYNLFHINSYSLLSGFQP